jgi:hypothetical protein
MFGPSHVEVVLLSQYRSFIENADANQNWPSESECRVMIRIALRDTADAYKKVRSNSYKEGTRAFITELANSAMRELPIDSRGGWAKFGASCPGIKAYEVRDQLRRLAEFLA